jgi:hypothetical protein
MQASANARHFTVLLRHEHRGHQQRNVVARMAMMIETHASDQ